MRPPLKICPFGALRCTPVIYELPGFKKLARKAYHLPNICTCGVKAAVRGRFLLKELDTNDGLEDI
ncbi:hypothetical protein A0H81_10952 [Grifola frondosa]|uniref:Uncharacterized protein n=1 Tax=Grifola frondosa TaxID=5627 RepID=A0A1C7LYG5_GRIFR|nr:hypothetical protein A0H81_10952 [Grifola frondosa]